MSIQVFISHSNQEPDKSFAMALARELGVLGVSVWLDHRELVAGNLDEKIIGAIQESRAVLTVWSRHSTNSAFSSWFGGHFFPPWFGLYCRLSQTGWSSGGGVKL